jgi:tetratricopeptide (TPR) repeat protein
MIRVHAGFTATALLLLSLIWQLPEAQAQARSDIKELRDTVIRLHREGRYGEATEVAKRVVALSERTYGREHVQVGIALDDLAILYAQQKRDREAMPLFARALSIMEREVGPNSPDLTGLLASLARTYQAVGRAADAEPLFKRALSILEKAPRTDREALRTALAELARVYSSQRRLVDAEPLLKRELAITEEIAGRDHLDTAKSAYVLALVQSRVGHLAEAEPLFRRALAIWDAQKPDQPEIPTAIQELWTLLVMQHRYADAIPVLQRAIGLAERTGQTNSTTFVATVETLAHANRLLGRYGEAEALLKRALAAEEKARGPGAGAVLLLTAIGISMVSSAVHATLRRNTGALWHWRKRHRPRIGWRSRQQLTSSAKPTMRKAGSQKPNLYFSVRCRCAKRRSAKTTSTCREPSWP